MATILGVILFIGYPWPMRPFNSAHQVSAALGDARGDSINPRFHRGIDIPASPGTAVFSIVSDTAIVYIDPPNSYVRVGDYCYIHVNPVVDSGVYVLGIIDTVNTPPDTIGTVLEYPGGAHLHFQVNQQDHLY